MKTLKRTSIITCFLVCVFCLKTHSQSKKINSETWNSFKESAHRIGFCIYQMQQEFCNKHAKTKQELEKISLPESLDEVYYFLINPNWANNRLSNLAKNNQSNYLILFDIDQKSFKKLYDSTKTSNSYNMLSIIDLKQEYQFKTYRETDSLITFYISSNKKNSILTNTMWREFMSNRLGRLETEIEITLNGINARKDYYNFKKYFLKYIKNRLP